MDALCEAQPLTDTPAVVLLDNDSRVTEGWLPPLLAAMADGHAVVTPLILEREGVDRGAALRNHLYTGELRVRSEETSEIQSLMRISYAVFCLNKKKANRLH